MQKRLTTRWLSEENAQEIFFPMKSTKNKKEIQKEIDEINEKLKILIPMNQTGL